MDKDISESRLQQECFMWHWNEYPMQRGLLFRIKNEGSNKITGARDKAMGLVAGVADMCLLLPRGRACFIEFKTEKGKQSDKQKHFESIVKMRGCDYYIIRSKDEFVFICKEVLVL